MSDGNDEPNTPNRDARGRYVKGTTGNPRGRPSKKRWLPVPNQIARSALEIAMQEITIQGPNGPQKMTKGALVVEAIYVNAMKGKAASQKQCIELMSMGMADLSKRHPLVDLAETMRQLYEEPNGEHSPDLLQAVDEWIRRTKRL